MFVTEPNTENEDSVDVLKQNVEATQLTMKAIRRLIQDRRASVRDVDSSGNTLAHVSKFQSEVEIRALCLFTPTAR